MKIATYNVARNEGDIVSVLRSIGADVVCLQEVGKDDCEELADGLNYVFGE